MKSCTISSKHKWTFVRNKLFETRTLRTRSFQTKGIYKCACGENKVGAPGFEQEQPA